MRFVEWFKKQKLKFKVVGSLPRPEDPNILGVGKLFITDTGKKVIAERIVGNIRNSKKFEITAHNEQHTISMLEFYFQLRGERPTEEEIADWDSIELLSMAPIVKKESNEDEETRN